MLNEEKAKRKTTTSSAVKKRYNSKTYNQYTFSLRKDDNADLISYIENQKAKGLSAADVIRKLYQSSSKPE